MPPMATRIHPTSQVPWGASKVIAVRISTKAIPLQMSQVCHEELDLLARTFRDVGPETNVSIRRGPSPALLTSPRAGTNTASSAGLIALALVGCGDGSSRA